MSEMASLKRTRENVLTKGTLEMNDISEFKNKRNFNQHHTLADNGVSHEVMD